MARSTQGFLEEALGGSRVTVGGEQKINRSAGGIDGDVVGEIEFAGLPATTGGCEGPAPDYSMAVRGGEPAWSLTVTGSGIEFSRGGGQPTITFPAVTPDDSGGFTRYQAASPGGEHTLHLLLSRTGCTGSRAAAMYAAMQARAVIDGQSLSGCAWKGRLP